jgi:polysaccharide biosynthesis/export protein
MASMSARVMAVVAMLLMVGCAHRVKTTPVTAEEPYRIGREDVLDIAVWRDPDLSRVVPVRPDGFISMPLVGDVEAAGKTPVELAEALKAKLKPFVQEPKVTVVVREINSARVFVLGEVANPGVYPLRGRVSVIQAIAMAGGFSAFANQDGIRIQGQDGVRYQVRYSDLISDEDNEDTKAVRNLTLRPVDTVVVP